MQLNKLHVGLGGGSVLQLANREGAQMMSYLIETPDGKTVMIDGGHPCEKDACYLYTLLKQRGATVDLWLITHGHNDHYGALYWLLKNVQPFDLHILDIRFTFPPLEWFRIVENAEEYPLLSDFYKLLEIHHIIPNKFHMSDIINCGGMSFEVLNNCTHYFDCDTINDTSIVIKAHFPKRDILFLGDLGPSAGRALLSVCPPEKLKCDIVQMAHHGQRGVDQCFYEVVRPKICLYPTPDWLWNNDNGGGKDSGPWETLETRNRMEELGAQCSCPSAYGDYLLE